MATSIRLSPELERRLDSLAARTGRTKAFYLRETIERGLDDVGDHYRSGPEADRPGSGARDDLAERRRGFLERAARLRGETAGRTHTPSEVLVREDRARRSETG